MQRRSEFLTFLTALIPGVGYMYYGLIRKGIEALAIFLLIEPVFNLMGLSFLVYIVRIVLWFYTFFDTYNVARKVNNGEVVEDSDFLFNFGEIKESDENTKNGWCILGWFLIVVGILAVLNKVLNMSNTYNVIKQYAGNYIFPALFIFCGIYLLYRNKK